MQEFTYNSAANSNSKLNLKLLSLNFKLEAGTKGNSSGDSKPQRAAVMTTSVEMLKITTDVDAASVAIPAGFTEKK